MVRKVPRRVTIALSAQPVWSRTVNCVAGVFQCQVYRMGLAEPGLRYSSGTRLPT
jgi:hypothetical protein